MNPAFEYIATTVASHTCKSGPEVSKKYKV